MRSNAMSSNTAIAIDIIDSFPVFQRLRHNWDALYAADPQAQFFLSSTWLTQVFQRYETRQDPWFILAAKLSDQNSDLDSNYIAFFPLKITVNEITVNQTTANEHQAGWLHNELCLADVCESDHIGFICLPDYEASVIPAFAQWIQQQNWSIFQLANMPTGDGRLRRLLKQFLLQQFAPEQFAPEQFAPEQFAPEQFRHRSVACNHDLVDEIDNSIIPYIDLPDTWEQYLQTLSTNTRQRINRFLRKIEGSDQFQISHVNPENIEQHIDILLDFWHQTWVGRKGAAFCQGVMRQTKETLLNCFEQDCLAFPVLWQGNRPLAAIANFIDSQRQTMLFFIGGRDDSFKDLPPGFVLHAFQIRHAIQSGFKIYDFLMGNEAYKFSFGAKTRTMETGLIERNNWQTQPPTLHPRTLAIACKIASHRHRNNHLATAGHAYKQILDAQPNFPDALYGLAVINQRQGDFPAAETLLKQLLQIQPNEARAWFSLGILHQLQSQLLEAETAYRKALSLQPETSAIALATYHNLGHTLQQQGKWEEAIACYQIARDLQPDSPEAETAWANALYAQGKLDPDQQLHYAAMNYTIGLKRQQAGDLKSAIEYYQQAIAMQSSHAELYFHLGQALQNSSEQNSSEQNSSDSHNSDLWQQAIAAYEKAQALQPDYPEAEVALAHLRHLQGDLSLEQQHHYAAMNYRIGQTYQQAGEWQGAIAYYEQAIGLQPDWAEAHYHLGQALQHLGHWQGAIACYQAARELQPDSFEAELAWANVQQSEGTLTPEQQVQYAELNYQMGQQYEQERDLRSAIASYQQALQMQPDWAEAREALRLAMQVESQATIKVSTAKR
jgi:tetratricopeptide (TPR) repeat protein